jgi:hypothetical protein
MKSNEQRNGQLLSSKRNDYPGVGVKATPGHTQDMRTSVNSVGVCSARTTAYLDGDFISVIAFSMLGFSRHRPPHIHAYAYTSRHRRQVHIEYNQVTVTAAMINGSSVGAALMQANTISINSAL